MSVLHMPQLALAVARLKSEYQEMPGLSLTAAQAARLAGLQRPLAAQALRLLEEQGFLARNWSGLFLRREGTLMRKAWTPRTVEGAPPGGQAGLHAV